MALVKKHICQRNIKCLIDRNIIQKKYYIVLWLHLIKEIPIVAFKESCNNIISLNHLCIFYIRIWYMIILKKIDTVKKKR